MAKLHTFSDAVENSCLICIYQFFSLISCSHHVPTDELNNNNKDVAQWLMRRISNPKTLGSEPWWGRVRDSFSVRLSQFLGRLVCA